MFKLDYTFTNNFEPNRNYYKPYDYVIGRGQKRCFATCLFGCFDIFNLCVDCKHNTDNNNIIKQT